MEDHVVEVRKLLTNPPNAYGVVDIFANILEVADCRLEQQDLHPMQLGSTGIWPHPSDIGITSEDEAVLI